MISKRFLSRVEMTMPAQFIDFLKNLFLGVVSSLLFAAAAAAAPLVVGYSSVTSVFLPFWIGNEVGFYKKEGLDPQLIYIASSTTMAQAMFARQVAISTVNSGSVVSSGLQGGDLVLMGAVINTAAFYIMAPGNRQPSRFEG
jgi:ABC-type nitrate/sulfonate/bicarbonate transport system substrate-binding protein